MTLFDLYIVIKIKAFLIYIMTFFVKINFFV
jgi:hypothetical protein